MDIYIIDTNIVFSAAMNAKSNIGRFIMGASTKEIRFYAPNYLKAEITKHFSRLVERSGRPIAEVQEQIDLIYQKIHFISDDQIPLPVYAKAVKYVRDLDMDDLVFVALNEYLEAVLWTGDTKLYRHLIKRGYDRVVNFEELKEKYKDLI